MRSLEWTPDLAKRFWSDLAGTECLAEIAFSRFAASYLVELSREYLYRRMIFRSPAELAQKLRQWEYE